MSRSGQQLSLRFGQVRAWRWRRITIALVALLALVQAPFLGTSHALAYSCDSSHCYGVVHWSGGVTYGGTSILVRGLGAPNSGAGFITNEMWVADSPNYWVETGITVGPVQGHGVCTSDCYYWADNRPGSGYNEHFLANVPQTDYGKFTGFSVSNQGGGTFHVSITGYNGAYSGDSTGNSMSPNWIQTGMELYGSSGGYALQAQYTGNVWSTGGSYNYQTNDGGNGPPGGSNDTSEIGWGWGGGQHPGSPNSTGGTWYTQCSC